MVTKAHKMLASYLKGKARPLLTRLSNLINLTPAVPTLWQC